MKRSVTRLLRARKLLMKAGARRANGPRTHYRTRVSTIACGRVAVIDSPDPAAVTCETCLRAMRSAGISRR